MTSSSDDGSKHMILPTASEQLLNIDETDENSKYAETLRPLSIDTTPRINQSLRTDRTDRKYQSKKKEYVKKNRHSTHESFYSGGGDGGGDGHSRRTRSLLEGFPTDQQSQRTNKSRSQKENKTFGSFIAGPGVDGKWRYSNIFAPETARRPKRPSERGTNSVRAQSSPSLYWPPYITVPVLPYIYDPTCNPPIRSLSQAELQSYPIDPQSGLTMLTPHRTAQGKSTPSAYWKTQDVPPHGLFISDRDGQRIESMDWPGYSEFEIEYATLDKNEGESYLSKNDLKAIVQLARKCSAAGDNFDKVAAAMRTGLAEQFEGGKWHVIVSENDYGSHVASIPGALAKFLVGKLAFLIWQT